MLYKFTHTNPYALVANPKYYARVLLRGMEDKPQF